MKDYYVLMDYLDHLQSPVMVDGAINVATAEQHYKDDLKAGAFQFVDGSVEELPLAYQVRFLFVVSGIW